MTFTVKISNGKTEADFLDDTNFNLVEGGLRLQSPRYNKLSSAPLVGVHGNRYSQVEYQNRMVTMSVDVKGSTYPTLMANVNTLSKLINEANGGSCVDLVIQVQDSDTSYLKILSGALTLPDQMFSLEGVHWYDGAIYSLNNIKLNLETSPFFTDYPSYETEGDVTRSYDATVDNGDTISLTDIAGDITTETILEFVGAYSNGTQKIYIGTGTHSLSTNLTNAINGSQTTFVVDEDYQGKLLVPFYVDIDATETDCEVTNIDDGTWTVVRGAGATSFSAGDPVVIQTRYDLDADASLSYCDMSNLRTGVVDSMSINAAGTDYTINEILNLTSGSGNDDCKLRVLSITSAGGISTFEITDGGSGYSASDTAVTVSSGTATFDIDEITSVHERGAVATASVNAGGTGYVQDEDLTVASSSGTDAVFNADTVSGGVVTAISIVTAGTEHPVGTGNATTGGSGSGCTIDIDTISANSTTTDDLNSNMTTLRVSGQGVHDLVTWTLDRHYVSAINQRCRIIGKEAQAGSGWNTALNYRVRVGYTTDNDSSFIELDKTDWKTPNQNTNALFDFGSVMIPPSGSVESAPDLTIILQVWIKADSVYDSSLDIINYDLDFDFIKLIPIGYGFRYINCGSVPFFINDKLVDDSRKPAPYVQEYSTEFLGEVAVDGIMPPVRLVPTNAGNTLTFLIEDGGGTASNAMTLDVEVGIIGNYLGLVD